MNPVPLLEPLVVYELLGPRSEASEADRAFAALVMQGFARYRERAFVEAQRLFEEAALKRPDDVACVSACWPEGSSTDSHMTRTGFGGTPHALAELG